MHNYVLLVVCLVSGNRKNSLAEAVSLELWAEPADRHPIYNLYADVVFQRRDVGAKSDESLVVFKLEVKRAELLFILSETEPCAVIQSSVSRDTPTVSGIITDTEKSAATASLHSRANIGSSQPDLSLGLSAGSAISTQREIVRKKELKSIDVLLSRDSDKNYVWQMTAAQGAFLEGRPWDAKTTPRLTLEDKRAKIKGLGPAVTMSLRCMRGDIVISNIRIKKDRWSLPIPIIISRNKRIAAEAYIKNSLLYQSSEEADFMNEYCIIELASEIITIGD